MARMTLPDRVRSGAAKREALPPLKVSHSTTPTSATPTVIANNPVILTVVKNVQILPQRDAEETDGSQNQAESNSRE